jgi:hypothetical protein
MIAGCSTANTSRVPNSNSGAGSGSGSGSVSSSTRVLVVRRGRSGSGRRGILSEGRSLAYMQRSVIASGCLVSPLGYRLKIRTLFSLVNVPVCDEHF